MAARTSWASFRSEVLALYEPPVRARGTYLKVRQVLDLVGALPGVDSPSDLTARTVARFAQSLDGRNFDTAKGLLGYLRSVCRFAAHEGHIRRSPFEYRRVWLRPQGRPPRRQQRHVPAADIARVLELLASGSRTWEGGRLYALVATLAYTGLRKMEALGLEAADVDLPARMIRLRSNSWRTLKTPESGLPVPVPEALAAVLEDWLPRCGSPLVIPTRNRRSPWRSGMLGSRPIDRLRQAGERAGVEGLTFLALRHSWATHAETLWRLSGPTIKRVMRHTTERTSEEWYRHADEANLRAAVAGIRYEVPPPAGLDEAA